MTKLIEQERVVSDIQHTLIQRRMYARNDQSEVSKLTVINNYGKRQEILVKSVFMSKSELDKPITYFVPRCLSDMVDEFNLR